MIKEKNTKILSTAPEMCLRMASRRRYRNGFVLSATFLCPKLDEEVNFNCLSCPKRQPQREEETGDRGNRHSWQNEQLQQAFHSVLKSMRPVSLCRTRTANTNELFWCDRGGKGGGGVSQVCLKDLRKLQPRHRKQTERER